MRMLPIKAGDALHGTCTPAEWSTLLRQCIHSIQALNIKPGERVVVTVPNDLRALVLLTALLQLEIVPAPLPATAPDSRREQVMASIDACYAIIDVRLKNCCELQVIAARKMSRSYEVPASLALILFTSGTSGLPKGVMLSRDGLSYQVETMISLLDYSAEDMLYLPLPLWHSYGLSLMLVAQCAGAGLYLDSSFSPRHLIQQILQHHCTTFDAVPAIYYSLVAYLTKYPSEIPLLSQQVRIWGSGGDHLSSTLEEHFLHLLHQPLLNGYGQTEAGPTVAISTPDSWALQRVGRPLPGTELRFFSEETQERPAELLVRSPSVMLGYWQEPQASTQVMSNGWLRTGDLARCDNQGFLQILGRNGRQIISSGCNISPEEVEDALLHIPDVREAAVLGLEDALRGEAVTAFVTVDQPFPFSHQQMYHLLSQSLEQFKLPRKIIFLADMPRLSNGKIDYQHLRHHALCSQGGN